MGTVKIEVYEIGPEERHIAGYWSPVVPREGEEIDLADFEGGYVVEVKRVQHITMLDQHEPRHFHQIRIWGTIIKRRHDV